MPFLVNPSKSNIFHWPAVGYFTTGPNKDRAVVIWHLRVSSVRFFQVQDLCDIDSLHQRFGDGRFQLCRHGHEGRGEIETTRRIFWTIFGLYGNGKSIHHDRI